LPARAGGFSFPVEFARGEAEGNAQAIVMPDVDAGTLQGAQLIQSMSAMRSFSLSIYDRHPLKTGTAISEVK
jgi:hypothetical protein